jgi:hypothetical protein
MDQAANPIPFVFKIFRVSPFERPPISLIPKDRGGGEYPSMCNDVHIPRCARSKANGRVGGHPHGAMEFGGWVLVMDLGEGSQ